MEITMGQITVQCPHCGREGKLPESVTQLPKAVKCPGCQSQFRPSAAKSDEFIVVPDSKEQLGEWAKRSAVGLGDTVKDVAKKAKDYATSDDAKDAMNRAWQTAGEIGGKAKDAASVLRSTGGRWQENPLWVGLAIFFFFPAGLYLLWKHPTLSRNKTWWWVGGVWSVLFVLAAANGDKDKKPATDTEAIAADEEQNKPTPNITRTSTPPSGYKSEPRVRNPDNDPVIQSMINSGTYTEQSARNMRDMQKALEKYSK
jgi:hypothetical protein